MANLLKNFDFASEGWHRTTVVIDADGVVTTKAVDNILSPVYWKTWFEHDPRPQNPGDTWGKWDQPEGKDARTEDRAYNGHKSYVLFTFYRPHRCGLCQVVDVEIGKKYRVSAVAHAWSNSQNGPHVDDPKWSEGAGYEAGYITPALAKDAPTPPGSGTTDDWRNFAFRVGVNQSGDGNCTGTGATVSVGACVSGGAFDDIEQRVNGDCTGDTYGVQCAATTGVQTITGGIASGGTYDLYRTAGTLQIASVSYDTYSGTITLLPESLNALQLAMVPTTELTIAAGVITKTQSYHRVDTQGDAASDDLDTINGATATGEILVLRPENDARTVVVKHNTGNIWLIGQADISLDEINDHIMLIYDGTMWCDL